MSRRCLVADPDVYHPWLLARDDELDGDAPILVDTDDDARRAETEFPGVAYLTAAELRIYRCARDAGCSYAEALAAARRSTCPAPRALSQRHRQ